MLRKFSRIHPDRGRASGGGRVDAVRSEADREFTPRAQVASKAERTGAAAIVRAVKAAKTAGGVPGLAG